MNLNLPVCTQANCKPAKHELFASNGCYKWEISHPHIIKMTEGRKRGNCVDSVFLQPVINRDSKTLVSIKAIDISSKLVLESQAKVGELASLAINMHYRHLYVNDKKHLDIVGFDDQGSIFSSMDGFRFDVTILEGQKHIKMTQKPDGYKHKRVNFQESSDILYLKGLTPGEARVRVHTLEPGYEQLQPVEVVILVIDPFVIEPQVPQFLLPTTRFDFKLVKLNKKDNGDVLRSPVKLPDSQYSWSVSESELGQVTQKGAFTSGVLNGTQVIKVVDTKMLNNTAEVEVNIVYPYQLIMNIHDVTDRMALVGKLEDDMMSQFNISEESVSETRILVEDHFYLISLQLLCKDGNRIKLTPNALFGNTGLDKNFISIEKVNQINSQVLIKTKLIDNAQEMLKTSFSFIKVKSDLDGQEYEPQNRGKLSLDAELVLTKPIRIEYPADLILLPYNPSEGQVLSTSATGGSGIYAWSVDNPDIVRIEGTVSIISQNVGKTTLKVRDHRNAHNMAQITVEVAHPTQLKQLEDQMELMSGNQSSTVGEQSVLNVIALDNQGRKFSNCTSLSFEYKTKADNIKIEPGLSLNYADLSYYVENSADLISLKHQFDQNNSIIFADDLPKSAKMPTLSQLSFNNFGICEQVPISAFQEGLARVKVTHKAKDSQRVIESEHAEIAVYKRLQTVQPVVKNHFNNLFSTNSQVGQEFTNFDAFFNPELLLLTVGSDIVWSVSGGTNFWQDYTEMYSVVFKVKSKEGTSSKDCLSVQMQNQKVTGFDISIVCNPLNDQISALNSVNKLTVEMHQHSKQSRHLLRPAQHSVSVDIECGPPKSARLLWANKNGEHKVLPSQRFHQNQQVHFVLTETEHRVRGILFDQQDLAYLRSQSVHYQISSSNQSLASVNFPENSYIDARENSTYDQRLVKFGAEEGQVSLRLEGNSFINSLVKIAPQKGGYFSSAPQQIYDESAWQVGELVKSEKEVSDVMRIQVVKEMEVEPKYKSLYVGAENAFVFNVLKGSGFFSVTLENPDLIDLVHKDRQIIVRPKESLGLVRIKIEDVMFPEQEPIYASVLVSEISKLVLWSPQSLMEQGDNVNLRVSAYDSNGVDFDSDQYENMQFSIETEMTGVMARQHGLKTESTAQNTEFTANGIEPGIYQLTAHTRLKIFGVSESSQLSSEMIRMEVFPLLQIYPSELLLTPNMKYTLQILGGPHSSVQSFNQGSSIEIQFDIEQTKVATVDQNREVTGLAVGDATLRYFIVQHRTPKSPSPRGIEEKSNTVISKKNVPIRVRLVTGIEIPQSQQRQIYSESLVKLIAVLKYENENFSHGIAPLSYNWVSSDGRVVSLQLPSDIPQKSKNIWNGANGKEATFQTYFNSSSIYVSAGKQGDCQVNLQVAIEYTSAYSGEKNWFKTSSVLKVTSQLQVAVNQYSAGSQATTHSYLLPPHATGFIKTNIDSKLKLGYSTMSVYDHSTNSYKSEEATSPIVKLIDNRGIQTMEKYGKVTVVVEQGGEQFSDQVAMLNVFITDIFSIQVMDAYQVLQMPLGSSVTLPIHFQNEHAVRFASEIDGVRLGFSLSHPKVLSVQVNDVGQTVSIQAQGSGDCSLYIYLVEHPAIFDEIKIKVSSLVRPLSPVNLHIGGQVEFKLFKPDEFGDQDKQISWRSNDPYTLNINQDTGKAQALKEGKVDVFLNNHMNAASIVHINRISFGQIDQHKALVLDTDEVRSGNKVTTPDDLRVRVKLYFNKNSEEIMPTVQYEGVTLIHQNIGISCETDQPDFVQATSETNMIEGFFCVLRYKQDANHQQMPRFTKVSVNAFAMLPGQSLPVYNEKIALFEVQMLSSIKIEQKFRNGVHFNPQQRQQVIRILSSSDFQVEVDGEHPIKFKTTRPDIDSNDYSLTLIVDSEAHDDFSTSLSISHPYTKQKHVVPIYFSQSDRRSPSHETYQERQSATKSIRTEEAPVFDDKFTRRAYEPSQDNWSFTSMFMLLVLTIGSLFFIKKQFDPKAEKEERKGDRFGHQRRYQVNYGGAGQVSAFKESRYRQYNNNNSFMNNSRASHNLSQSNGAIQRSPGFNLDRFGRNDADNSKSYPRESSLWRDS